MLSNTCKYAIRAVIYLAVFSSQKRKAGIKEISEALRIPSPFLGKILQILVKHSILESTKGPNGGFCLHKPALDISLMEIIEIIDGTELFDTCIIRTEQCGTGVHCSMHHKISPLRKSLKSLFTTESIADLVSEFKQDKENITI